MSIGRRGARPGLSALLLLLTAVLGGCAGGSTAPVVSSTDSSSLTNDLARKWSTSCVLCHVDGEGGAPRLGVAEEWRERRAKGADQLLAHTLEGFSNMPPLGYCMSCETEDFEALIEYMAGRLE